VSTAGPGLHDGDPRDELLAAGEAYTAFERRRFRRRRRTDRRGTRDRAIAEGNLQLATIVRETRYRRALALADAVAALATALIIGPAPTWTATAVTAAVAVLILVVLNKANGLYDRDDVVIRKTTLDDVPRLLQNGGLVALFALLFADVVVQATAPSGAEVALLWLLLVAAMVLARAAARAVLPHFTAPERCLMIGDDEACDALRGRLASARVNSKLIGRLSIDECADRSPDSLNGYLWTVLHTHGVQRVIIAPTQSGAADTLDLIRVAKRAGVRVSVLPRMFEVVGTAVEFDSLDGLTMLGVKHFGFTRSSLALKRIFDVCGAGLMLLVTAPLLALLALAVRLDSPGPAFFRQTRVGRDGRHFRLLKLRTMDDDAEQTKAGLRHLTGADDLFKLSEDPRITRVGRMLRRSSLDELPQLINVLRGEMSLVGPRPLVIDEDERVLGLDRDRLRLTPGMTGPWQILESDRVPLAEMVRMDGLYVTNWSLWTDVKILLRTVPHVFGRRGL
jgi:exopolysaccharide biosynthesis polyprenyl glycosylphosphotransferase